MSDRQPKYSIDEVEIIAREVLNCVLDITSQRLCKWDKNEFEIWWYQKKNKLLKDKESK